MNQTRSTPEPAIVLFDGVCNFCDASVNFIFRHDARGYFKFAALQSETGQRLTRQYNLENVDSVILIERGQAFVRSTAALQIARRLDGFWSWFYGFIVVPRVLRDAVYKIFARNRYLLFGKKSACALPSPDLQRRFIS